MPAMDGTASLARSRATSTQDTFRSSSISALDSREVKMRALDAGAEDSHKPVVFKPELCVRVRNLLRLKACGDDYEQYSRILESEVDPVPDCQVRRTNGGHRTAGGVTDRQAALLDLVQDAIVSCDLDWRVVLLEPRRRGHVPVAPQRGAWAGHA